KASPQLERYPNLVRSEALDDAESDSAAMESAVAGGCIDQSSKAALLERARADLGRLLRLFGDIDERTRRLERDIKALQDLPPCFPFPGVTIGPILPEGFSTGPAVQAVYGDLGVAGGANVFSSGGSITSHDVVTTDTEQRSQSHSRTSGVLGILGTLYGPGLPISTVPLRPLFQTGFLYNFNSDQTSSFNALGDNVANGTTKVSQPWSVPLLIGIDMPASFFGPNAHLQVLGGGMI